MMVHSKAWADNDWKHGGGAFNPASSAVIAGGATYSMTFRLTLAPSLRGVQAALLALDRPTFTAVPGYIVAPDLDNASLTVERSAPLLAITSVQTHPAGCLELCIQASSAPAIMTRGSNGERWQHPLTCPGLESDPRPNRGVGEAAPAPAPATAATRFRVRPGAGSAGQGRCRVTVEFADGMTAMVHYFVHEPAVAHTERYARALATRNFFEDAADAFSRAPSFMNVDRRENAGAGGVILQNRLAWIAGLSDECGAGPGVAMASKLVFSPEPEQVKQLARYVDGTLWGSDLARAANQTVQTGDFGVRYGTFRLNFHRFDRFELDLRGHTQP